MNPTEPTALLQYGPLGIVVFLVITMFALVKWLVTNAGERDKERSEEGRERAEVFLAHNKEIVKNCDERTEGFVKTMEASNARVIEAQLRQETALRDLTIEMRNTKPKVTQ